MNQTNSLSGATPLHVAVTSPKALEGRLECARLLLDAGAGLATVDARGNSALDCAVERQGEQPEMLALLRNHGKRSYAATAAAKAGDEASSPKADKEEDEDEDEDEEALPPPKALAEPARSDSTKSKDAF